MNETSKTRATWGPLEKSVLTGSGIDIGCGGDPVLPGVRQFDVEHGDANQITKHVSERFDFVYSSHCLEHMYDARKALLEWWQLVKPGGHLVFIVPDEDLYEQGVFPSRFNPDHKATFTLSKHASWSPVSHNVLDLAAELPGSRLVSLKLYDTDYRRRLLRHGPDGPAVRLAVGLIRLARSVVGWVRPLSRALNGLERTIATTDQTRRYALAQIQCIVRKES